LHGAATALLLLYDVAARSRFRAALMALPDMPGAELRVNPAKPAPATSSGRCAPRAERGEAPRP
jgi:hypothetical protein